MNYRLKYQVIGLALVSAIIPIGVLAYLMLSQQSPLVGSVDREIDKLIDRYHNETLDEVYGLCETSNDLVKQRIMDDINIASYLMNEAGQVTLSTTELITWDAVNQFTQQTKKIELPQFSIGNTTINKNTNSTIETPFVDKLKKLLNCPATIFQRMNADGDMIRIATTVQKLNRERAIETFIPAITQNGTPNPVISSLLEGKIYNGPAFVVNEWYITAYKPIKVDDQVIGAISIGIPQESINSLRKAIENVNVGSNGYAWVMYGSNENYKGKVLLRSKLVSDAYIINDETRTIYDDIRKQATKLENKETATVSSSWRDDAANQATTKRIYFTYFKEWDWVIGVTSYEIENVIIYNQVQQVFDTLMREILYIAFGAFILIMILAIWIGNLITRPITFLTKIAHLVARGNIFEAGKLLNNTEGNNQFIQKAHGYSNETNMLLQAMQQMIESLMTLITQVKRSSLQLMNASKEILDNAKVQENTASDFKSFTDEIAAAVKEISSTSQDLYRTMSNVADVAHDTASMADSSRGELAGMENTMQNLSSATRSISSKLSIITEKTSNINSVVTTISKVADQTNLLSLNASIEAEKAGEYGLGFGVVAREIRRLADQTALATLDIEQMVKEMQSSVTAGVMEMDKFTDEVRLGVSEVGRISDHLDKIIQQVQHLTPRYEAIKEGMQSQSQGAQHINDAMDSLSVSANKTANSAHRFQEATQYLQSAVGSLKQEISRFSIADQKNIDEKTDPETGSLN